VDQKGSSPLALAGMLGTIGIKKPNTAASSPTGASFLSPHFAQSLDDAVVVVIRAYFDNSGTQDDPQHNWVTLGGYLSNETRWEKFEAEWAANLADFELPYLHMKLFAHNLPPFERFKKDEAGRIKFLTNCIEIIKRAQPKAICHGIRLPDVDRFNKEFGRKIDALSFCLYLSYLDIREA
jgi:hypothetical protein